MWAYRVCYGVDGAGCAQEHSKEMCRPGLLGKKGTTSKKFQRNRANESVRDEGFLVAGLTGKPEKRPTASDA